MIEARDPIFSMSPRVPADAINGVVVVDKPVGPTSFDIVRQARRLTGARKVGHGGTLDPLASGVLPICFGEATKLAQFLLDADKEYVATLGFGVETDTYDAAGQITARKPSGHLRAHDIEAVLTGFLGEQAQIPPMYSALKRDGKPLYAYARDGETLVRAPRPIRIHALELRGFIEGSSTTGEADAVAEVFVRCSKGTYVRSLAFDVGRVLGTGAHLLGLRRTRSGPFGLDRAISLEQLQPAAWPVIALSDALAHLPSVLVPEDVARAVAQGKVVNWERAGQVISKSDPCVVACASASTSAATGLIRILAPDGQLLAVAPRAGDAEPIRTLRVFRQRD